MDFIVIEWNKDRTVKRIIPVPTRGQLYEILPCIAYPNDVYMLKRMGTARQLLEELKG